MDVQDPEKIVYRFKLPVGKTIDFTLNFDKRTFRYLPPDGPAEPWTNLEFHQCTHCPLDALENPVCPIARGLQEVALPFRDILSHQTAMVIVLTSNRNYSRNVSVQEGLFAIFGLIMATAGCPHFEFLRPLAFFHLPFATMEEYNFRFLSMYLLYQHLNQMRGLPADFELRKVDSLFDHITTVNRCMVERIRPVAKKDANLNSLTILDSYAQLFQMENASGYKSLEPFFFPEGSETPGSRA